MLRSLHMKLVMLMVLLILSLMTVVGAFLINSVVAFYIQDFYSQMSTVFGDQEIVSDLRTAADGETDGAGALKTVLNAYAGQLGVDTRNRNFYILDGEGTSVLASSNGESGASGLSYTGNLMTAIESGQVGDESNAAADYMDVAIPIQRGGSDYIIYILDNKATVSNLNNQLFLLIMEALLFGLVISVLLSFLLSKTMITPIQRLTEGAMRVAEGDFAHKIEVASRDEIGVLTDTFNDMAGQLQDTIRQVENERNKLNTLFLHMTDGVVAFSRTGEVIHFNPSAEEMLHRPIGTDTTFGELFGGLVSLERVLAVPDYLQEEQTVEERFLQLLMAPFDRDRQGGRTGGHPRRHRAAEERGDAPGVRGQRVPRAAHPPHQHPQLCRNAGGQRRRPAPSHGEEVPGSHPQRERPHDPHRAGSAHPVPVRLGAHRFEADPVLLFCGAP